jgi:2-(1,2-epoxy-1,2-dihydrophenyl)acetyl-CoA isomerase
MFETIKYNVENGVAWITLNRPDKLNAFIEQLNKEVTSALKEVENEDVVRAIVITGEGRAFCSGQDLADVKGETDFSNILRERYNPMITKLVALEKPVIAAVNGTAAGAGMSLALACDFRLLSEKASFIEAFIHVGLIPDSGNMYFLPRLVGHAKALELAMLGEKISAKQADELGFATKLIREEDWDKEVRAFAERLAAMPTKALGLTKRYLRRSWDCDLEEMLENEAYGQRVAGQTSDHQEGVQAFIEKRKPEFTGE